MSVATSCKDAETAEQQRTRERRRFSTRRENTPDAAQWSGNEASSSKAEELASGAASQRVEQSGTVSQRAESTKNADDIMDEIRSLGY